MRMDQKSWNSKEFKDAVYRYEQEDNHVQAVSTVAAVGVFGFLVAVAIYGVAMWGVAEILFKQGIVDWRFEPWQPYLLSLIYFTIRSMNRVMYPKK